MSVTLSVTHAYSSEAFKEAMAPQVEAGLYEFVFDERTMAVILPSLDGALAILSVFELGYPPIVPGTPKPYAIIEVTIDSVQYPDLETALAFLRGEAGV